ncbi:DMT family transporter [Pseudactinotalea sp. HY158]|uniref:DMT family transporter n=1 Tax=Pseudactinotalea sp. HY158 TaxID=2654547 RepID=UPI00129C68FA|nr:DMT family transporter [Pseudactinotalea sp. HY158]QGH70171.1 EamA family transporter [Pseudactinotalea sp. HY158]
MLGALGLVIAAAVFHAVWNIAAKRHEGDDADSLVFVWCYLAVSAVLCVPLALVELGAGGWPMTWHLLAGPLVAAVLHIAYSLTLQRGYARAELGLVYPVARGVGPVLTMAFALLVVGERPGWRAVAGGCVVLAGIVVTAWRPGPRRAGGPGSTRTGLGYGALTGVIIASYTLWDNHSVVAWGLSPLTYFAATVLGQTLLLAPGALRRVERIRPVLRRNRREVVLIGVLSPLAYILVLVAMQTMPVSIVAPLRESSIIIGSLLAWWLFREPHPVRRIAGAAVVLAGIGVIATA